MAEVDYNILINNLLNAIDNNNKEIKPVSSFINDANDADIKSRSAINDLVSKLENDNKSNYSTSGTVIGKDPTDECFRKFNFIKKELMKYLCDMVNIETTDTSIAPDIQISHLIKYDNDIPTNYKSKGYEHYFGTSRKANIPLGESLARMYGVGDIIVEPTAKPIPITTFHIPDILWNAIRRSINAGKIGWNRLPSASTILNKGVKRYNLLCQSGLPPYTACAMTGMLWFEDGWNPKNGINKQEAAGKGASGTEGYAGAGEGWFGLTYWKTKWRIIQNLGIDALKNAGLQISGYTMEEAKKEYNKPKQPGKKWLHELGDTWWGKILKEYVRTTVSYLYNILFRNEPTSDADRVEDIAASYLFKAGNFGGKCSKGKSRNANDWVYDAVVTSETYMKSHIKHGFTKYPTDAFCGGILVACMLASCMKEGKDNKTLRSEFASLNIPNKNTWTI